MGVKETSAGKAEIIYNRDIQSATGALHRQEFMEVCLQGSYLNQVFKNQHKEQKRRKGCVCTCTRAVHARKPMNKAAVARNRMICSRMSI